MDIVLALALLRGAHMAALLSLLGALVFPPVAAPCAGGKARARIRRLACASAALAFLLGVAWLVGTAAYVAGAHGPAEAIAAVPAVVTYMGFGKLLLARLVLLALAVGLLLDRAARPLIALAPAALAVALQPLMGHAGAIGAVVPIGAEMLHLLAVAVWIGGLLPLLVSLADDSRGARGRTLRRFSILGAVAVGTIAASGATMGAALAGGLRGLLGTEYGLALQLKTGLFAAALALAALNRFVLAARLDEVEPGPAPALLRALRLSIAAELGLGLVIILTAGILASLPPGAERMASSLAWAPILTALAVQALATAVVAALWLRCHVFLPHFLRSDPR